MAKLFSLATVLCLLSLSRGDASNQIKLSDNVFARDDAFKASGLRSQEMLSIDIIEYVRNGYINQELLSVLEPENEAWISNVAEFSYYVSYHGCWKNLDVSHEVFVYNTVYECSKIAGCTGQYVGLSGTRCFCFTKKPDEELKTDDSVCNETCVSFFGEPCGGENAISLYEVIRGTSVDMASTGKQFKQCVILNKALPPNKIIEWSTESCYGYCDNCQYICSLCNDTGTYMPRDVRVENSYTWIQAQQECKKRGECNIMDHTNVDLTSLAEHMAIGHRYWTGVFRTFTTISSSMLAGSDRNACVFVRKKNKTLQFETTNCSDKKRYLYLGDAPSSPKPTTMSTRIRTTTQIQTTITPNQDPDTATTQGSGTTPTRSFTEKSAVTPGVDDDSSSLWMIVIIASSTAAVVVVVIAMIVICRKKTGTKSVASAATGNQETRDTSHGGRQEGQAAGGANQDCNTSKQNGHLHATSSLQYDSIPSADTDQEDYAEIAEDQLDEKARLGAPSADMDQEDYAEIREDQLDEKARLGAPSADAGAGKLSPRKPERRTLKMKQKQTDDTRMEDNGDSTYNVLNEIQNSVDEPETCNVYSHLETHTRSGATPRLVSETDNVYDHTGMQSAASVVSKNHPGESSEYNSLSNIKDTTGTLGGHEDVYDHTFDRKKADTVENTYNVLQTHSTNI